VPKNNSADHHIQLNGTSILAKKSRCMDRIIREAVEFNSILTTSAERMGSS
jgi:hypothetical protein